MTLCLAQSKLPRGRRATTRPQEPTVHCLSSSQSSDVLQDGPPAVESCLGEGKRGMKRALLEVIAVGVVKSSADLQRFVHATLLAATAPNTKVRPA